MEKRKQKNKDENQLAKGLIDDIIEETESENWDKEKPQIASAATKKLKTEKNKITALQ